MSKSYSVTLRRGIPGAESSVTTSVQADSVMDAQAKACRLFPAWSCSSSEVKEEQDFDECAASGQGHSFGDCGPRGETQCRYCGVAPKPDTASTAHIDRSGASVRMGNGAVMHFTSGDADPLRGAGDRRWWPINGARTLSHGTYRKWLAAVVTLEALGYTYEGGEQWKPPLGRRITVDLTPTVNKSIASVVLAILNARAAEWEKVSVNGCHEEQVRATGRHEALAIASELRRTFARAGLL